MSKSCEACFSYEKDENIEMKGYSILCHVEPQAIDIAGRVSKICRYFIPKLEPNCISYCSDTGKCNSIKGSCTNKNMNNLDCKSNGVYTEGHKTHDYHHNRAGGNETI